MRGMQAEMEHGRVRREELENNIDCHYYKKMKLKTYNKYRRNRLESSSILPGKADSELKPYSQETLEGAMSDIRLHCYSTAKRHLVI